MSCSDYIVRGNHRKGCIWLLTLGRIVLNLYSPKGSDDGVQHSESPRFWTLSIVRNSKKARKQNVSETSFVSILR
jgi:hypothetical protein